MLDDRIHKSSNKHEQKIIRNNASDRVSIPIHSTNEKNCIFLLFLLSFIIVASSNNRYLEIHHVTLLSSKQKRKLSSNENSQKFEEKILLIASRDNFGDVWNLLEPTQNYKNTT